MIHHILKQFIAFPLVIMVATASIFCCCFTDAVSASTLSSKQKIDGHSAHCGAGADSSSEQHDANDCDCPPILAEAGSLTGKEASVLSNPLQNLFNKSFGPSESVFNHPHIASATLDPSLYFHHYPHSTPLFILNHILRI